MLYSQSVRVKEQVCVYLGSNYTFFKKLIFSKIAQKQSLDQTQTTNVAIKVQSSKCSNYKTVEGFDHVMIQG